MKDDMLVIRKLFVKKNLKGAVFNFFLFLKNVQALEMEAQNRVVFFEVPQVEASNYLEILPFDILKEIIDRSPVTVRGLNKKFYFLTSGYKEPPKEIPGRFIEPDCCDPLCRAPAFWQRSLNLEGFTDLSFIPSPVWYGLVREVKNIPLVLITNIKGTQIHILNLECNWMGNGGVKKLSLQGTQVHILNLTFNGIGNKGAKELSLKGTQVQVLNLSYNNIGDKGAKELPLHGTQVQVLDLSCNDIGDEGAKGLPLQGTQVQVLDLSCNGIGDEGAKGLPLQGTQVQVLHLSHNDIGDEGAKGLPLQGTLIQEVYLGGNPISFETQSFLTKMYPSIKFIFKGLFEGDHTGTAGDDFTSLCTSPDELGCKKEYDYFQI